MLIKAIEEANESQKKELFHWLSKKEFNSNEKIKAITQIYDEIDIKTICQAKIESLFAEATKNLDEISIQNESKQNLRDYALQLLNREK